MESEHLSLAAIEMAARWRAALARLDAQQLSDEQTRKLLHELQVYHVEIEMQQDELRNQQVELEQARSHHFDLFDMAPVGYCIVKQHGLLIRINQRAAQMLGAPVDELLGRPLTPAHRSTVIGRSLPSSAARGNARRAGPAAAS